METFTFMIILFLGLYYHIVILNLFICCKVTYKVDINA